MRRRMSTVWMDARIVLPQSARVKKNEKPRSAIGFFLLCRSGFVANPRTKNRGAMAVIFSEFRFVRNLEQAGFGVKWVADFSGGLGLGIRVPENGKSRGCAAFCDGGLAGLWWLRLQQRPVYAQAGSGACTDRSSSCPTQSDLVCRSGRSRRTAKTSCVRWASLN